MASRTSTPHSRSRSSSTESSGPSDTMMPDAPPHSPSRPVRLRHPSTSSPSQGAPAAPSDPTFSLLLALPREIRDRVYQFTLTSQYPFWWPNQAPIRHQVGLNLLRTNKQICDESVAILYKSNRFLFTHPSDCNIFRIVAGPASQNITTVYFRIREKDLRLWTTYLGSTTEERSLKADLPHLKSLWIFMRCGSMGTPAMLGHLGQGGLGMQGGGFAGLPPAVAVQVQAVQHALGQQVQALQQQQQLQSLTYSIAGSSAQNQHGRADDLQAETGSLNDQIPPPPPPPSAMPFIQFAQGGFPGQQGQQQQQQNLVPQPQPGQQQGQLLPAPQNQPQQPQQPHTLYTSFLRFEREMGIESLCLSLQETRLPSTEVKIVCIMRIPRREVERLVRLYPEELCTDKYGDARTRFRKLHGVQVSLEVSGYDVLGQSGQGGDQ